MTKLRSSSMARLNRRLSCVDSDGWEDMESPGLQSYAFREGVAHLLLAGSVDTAASLLSDFAYCMARLASEGASTVRPMAMDATAVLEIGQGRYSDDYWQWEAFFRTNSNLMERGRLQWGPERILLQLALELADQSPVTRSAEEWLEQDACEWRWAQKINRPSRTGGDGSVRVFEGHPSVPEHMVTGVFGLSVTGEDRMASWGDDRCIRIWRMATGQELAVLQGHNATISGAIFLSEDKLLSWSRGDDDAPERPDSELRIWDIPSGECVDSLQGGVQFPPNFDGRICTLVDPHGRLLTWCRDETFRYFDLFGPEPLTELRGRAVGVPGHLLTEPAQERIWFLHPVVGLSAWSLDSGLETARIPSGHDTPGWKMRRLSENLVVSWRENALELFDVTEAKRGPILRGQDGDITGAVYLGATIASTSWGLSFGAEPATTLCLWDLETGTLIRGAETFKHGAGGLISVGDGFLVCWPASPVEKDLLLFDEDLNLIRRLTGHRDRVWGAQSVSSQRFLSWSSDGDIRLWSLEGLLAITPAQEPTDHKTVEREGLSGPEHTIRFISNDEHGIYTSPLLSGGVALSSADRALVWTAENNLIEVFDLTRDAERSAIAVDLKGYLTGAAFIDAEKILSWGSGDRLLQVWNHRTGELCLAIEVNKEPSQAVIENSGGTELDAMFEMALGDDDELADDLNAEMDALFSGELSAADPDERESPAPTMDDLLATELDLSPSDENQSEDSGGLDLNDVFEAIFDETSYGLILTQGGLVVTWEEGSSRLSVWNLFTGSHHCDVATETRGIRAAGMTGRRSLALWYEDGHRVSLDVPDIGDGDGEGLWNRDLKGVSFVPDQSPFCWTTSDEHLLGQPECPAPTATVKGAHGRYLEMHPVDSADPIEWHTSTQCVIRGASDGGVHFISEKRGKLEFETVCVRVRA